MPEFRKRRTRAEVVLRFLGSVGIMLGLGALALGSSFATWHIYQKLQDATQAADAAQSQLSLLVSEEAQVKSYIAELQTPRGLETALRERYGVAKSGEGVIQIVQNQPVAGAATSTASSNFFSRIFHTLFNW